MLPLLLLFYAQGDVSLETDTEAFQLIFNVCANIVLFLYF